MLLQLEKSHLRYPPSLPQKLEGGLALFRTAFKDIDDKSLRKESQVMKLPQDLSGLLKD